MKTQIFLDFLFIIYTRNRPSSHENDTSSDAVENMAMFLSCLVFWAAEEVQGSEGFIVAVTGCSR